MTQESSAFHIGTILGCAAAGQPIKSASVIESRVVDSPELDRWLLRIGETAYRETGRMGCLGYQICKRASSAAVLGDPLRAAASVIARAIGRDLMEKSAAAENSDTAMDAEEIKEASMGWLRGLLGGTAALAPDAGKILLGGAIGVGATGGGLAWAANRGIKNDEADIEAMKAKIKTYRRITQDIDEELASRGVSV